ncbi:MAG: amidase [Actinomycetota bacterium]
MADTDDLHAGDATALAAAIASGSLSAREAVDAALRRIEATNPELNAVIWIDPEAAMAAADALDRGEGPVGAPFAGVPFLLKDIGATQAGLPYWRGNRALRDVGHRRDTDTELGARFRAAGLITLGKTNLPEFGSSPTTQPLGFGATANPWDPTRSPAGSSGGAGAAVASGMVPIAHANDGGGSTRLPAAWCGLVGLKPTRGRVPDPELTSRSVSELVVTQSVRDTARLLDSVAGATEADLFRAPEPSGPFIDAVGRNAPTGLRIGLLTDGGRWEVDPACVAAAEATGQLLESMGHHVEPVTADVLLGEASAVNGRLWTADIARSVAAVGEVLGRPATDAEIEPYNWTAAVRGREQTAVERAALVEGQQRWVHDVARWLAPYDVLLTPTSGAVPMRTDELWPDRDAPWRIGRTYAKIGAFTMPFNVTGHPGISLPLQWTDDGLPIGVQLVAGMGREELLLSMAGRLEEAVPWANRYPAAAAG